MVGKSYPINFVLGVQDLGSAEFGRSVGRMKTNAEKLSAVGNKLTLGVTAPILGIGLAAERASIDFEDKISNIGTIIDTSVENLDAIGQKVLEMRRLPVPLGDMADALYDVRSAGVSAADQFGVLEGSAKLGVAGLGTTKEAADLATSAINGFHLEGEKARKLYDNIFLTTQFGKTTISGLAQGFGSVAATVASTGTELDEYLSAVAALTTTGLPAAEAHTQIKAAISGLTRPSKENSALFRQLGAKDLPALIKQSGGLVPALRAVADVASANSATYQKLGAKDFPDLIKKSGGYAQALEKLEAVGGKNSAAILKSVGSTEALNAVLSLTGPVAATQVAALDKMRESEGALEDAFEKKAATRKARLQATRNEIEATAISIGDKMAPAVLKLTKSVDGMLGAFNGLPESSQQTAIWSAAVLASLGPILKMLTAIQMHPVIAGTLAVGALVANADTIGALAFEPEAPDETPEARAKRLETARVQGIVKKHQEEIKRQEMAQAAGYDSPKAYAAALTASLRAPEKNKTEVEIVLKTPPGVSASTTTKTVEGSSEVKVRTGKAMNK